MSKMIGRLLAAVTLLAGVLVGGVVMASPAQATTTPACVAGNFTYLNTDTLMVDQTIYPNQYLMSSNGMFILLFQGDGDVVLWGNRDPKAAGGCERIWHSGSAGQGGNHLVLQPDSNFVLYRDSTPVWASYTSCGGCAPSHVAIQSDGNLVEYSNGMAVWHVGNPVATIECPNPFGSDMLDTNQTLQKGWYLRSSAGTGRYSICIVSNGDLIFYGPAGHVLWRFHPSSTTADRLLSQSDGNVVLYNASGQSFWSTGTCCTAGAWLATQEDGNNVVYGKCTGAALWSSGTAGQI